MQAEEMGCLNPVLQGKETLSSGLAFLEAVARQIWLADAESKAQAAADELTREEDIEQKKENQGSKKNAKKNAKKTKNKFTEKSPVEECVTESGKSELAVVSFNFLPFLQLIPSAIAPTSHSKFLPRLQHQLQPATLLNKHALAMTPGSAI